MHIIMIPGFWLDGSSWDAIAPALRDAGHDTHPLTLPGMESKAADRAVVTLQDHVGAVVEAIDGCGSGDPVMLVAHSAGCGLAHAAIDARPDRVTSAVYIGGFPTGNGDANPGGYAIENGEVPLPAWSDFDDEDLADLDDGARNAFRERAIPTPGRAATDLQRLSDGRRYDVPVTVVCTEFSSNALRSWIDQGLAPVREFTRIRDVTYVDLPTGHWPQFTRPDDLARIILEAAGPGGE